MIESTRGHTIVFKTGQLHELDMAANVLSDEGIPFFKETESSSAVRLPMPLQPEMGPETWYSILVPDQLIDHPKSVLSNLPFEIGTDPAIWHIGWRLRETNARVENFCIVHAYYSQNAGSYDS